jgi:hypothetical protein
MPQPPRRAPPRDRRRRRRPNAKGAPRAPGIGDPARHRFARPPTHPVPHPSRGLRRAERAGETVDLGPLSPRGGDAPSRPRVPRRPPGPHPVSGPSAAVLSIQPPIVDHPRACLHESPLDTNPAHSAQGTPRRGTGELAGRCEPPPAPFMHSQIERMSRDWNMLHRRPGRRSAKHSAERSGERSLEASDRRRGTAPGVPRPRLSVACASGGNLEATADRPGSYGRSADGSRACRDSPPGRVRASQPSR